jgi:hypothetical protein
MMNWFFALQYPHWMMIAGATLVAIGFVDLRLIKTGIVSLTRGHRNPTRSSSFLRQPIRAGRRTGNNAGASVTIPAARLGSLRFLVAPVQPTRPLSIYRRSPMVAFSCLSASAMAVVAVVGCGSE